MFIFWFCYHFRWFFKYVFNIADYNTFFKYANIASDYNAFSCISNYNVFEDISLWSFRLKYLSGISLIFQLLRFFFFYYILYNFSGISLKILIFFSNKNKFSYYKDFSAHVAKFQDCNFLFRHVTKGSRNKVVPAYRWIFLTRIFRAYHTTFRL